MWTFYAVVWELNMDPHVLRYTAFPGSNGQFVVGIYPAEQPAMLESGISR
jgi:hypothetical protein